MKQSCRLIGTNKNENLIHPSPHLTIVLLLFFIILFSSSTYASLTKSDIEEIRKIIKEELVHVDKRFDDMNNRFDDLKDSVNKGFDYL